LVQTLHQRLDRRRLIARGNKWSMNFKGAIAHTRTVGSGALACELNVKRFRKEVRAAIFSVDDEPLE